MNKGYNELTKQKTTLFRRPPQVKSSKAQIYTKFHKIPEIRFEDQQLTSFSGLLIFQLLFKRLNLKARFKGISHIRTPFDRYAACHPSDSWFQAVERD
ncbi:MAG: hypothetical protein GXP56_08465 [Deltaproteobacteria bacterium]|nr:hypothetical protein [Deltaproteobacteria bacterium]